MPKHPIVGTYKMVSFEGRTSDGDVSYPFGPDGVGCLTITADGYFFANVMHANRPHSASADRLAGSLEERAAAADTFVAYCGPYKIDGNTITTHVVASSFPNWTGGEQKRWFELKDNTLILETDTRFVGGKKFTGVVQWKRI
ncbi:MAG: lipocalin-like domain-containing protein [Planctomycetota bacterium]|jgi:hypothetical protein